MSHVFYVSAGLLSPEHMQRIDRAIWEFLWLISHETREEGKVLNGAPITVGRIAEDLGESKRSVLRHLDRLESEGYIVRSRATSGEVYSYRIANSKKWAHDKSVTGEPMPVLSPGDDKSVTGGMTDMSSGVAKSVTANKEVDRSRQVDKVDKATAPKNGAARPTLQDVTHYCKERGNAVNPQQWMDHYTANGWKVGRNPMKDWRAAVRTWESNQVKGHGDANKAERRQAHNLAARESAISAFMANRPADHSRGGLR